MAKIIGAVASSHSPTIGFAYDTQKQEDPVWAPIFEAYKPVQAWLEEKKPDVLFVIFNDHVTSFFFDHYSQFALGIGDSYAVADEGGGPRPLPPVKGHTALAHHIAAALVADEFDLSFFQDRPLDHGFFSPLCMMWPQEAGLAGAVVPIAGGGVADAVATARRCYKLGQSLRKAIESYPEDLSVVIVATGGLSHQVHGERAGFNNPEWDMQLLDLIENDPVTLTQLTIADYAQLGGWESAEVVMWLIMRGALSASVKKIHQSYYLPSMTALATAVYENQAAEPTEEAKEAYREHIHHALGGRGRTRRYVSVHAAEQREGLPPEQISTQAHRTRPSGALPVGSRSVIRRSATDYRRTRNDPAPGLAQADSLWRDFFPAGKTGRGNRRFQSAHLCCNARGRRSRNSKKLETPTCCTRWQVTPSR